MQFHWNTMFWGAVLRMMEALLSAAPTILCGLFVVGIINRLLGYAGTRRLFGTGRWRALPQAWGLGMLLPVCSLGVIPVCRELRRTGLTGGVLLAFGLSAPLFNPLSLLYGLTLAKPFAIFAFAGCSLVVLTFVGGMWDRLLPTDSMSEAEPRRVAPGIRRMLAVGVSVCREAASPTMIYILIGLLGMAALGAWLPFGSLQTALNSGDLQAPLLMLGVGLPAYVTPMNAMMQIGSMFHHGNSIGAAFVLLTIGAGTNLGLLAWVVVNYGVRRTAGWIGLVIGVVLVLAYLIEHPLVDMTAINQAHVEEHPHTHAFDMYCQPFPQEMEVDAGFVLEKLKSQALPHELTCLSLVGALLIAGSGLRVIERRFSLNDWLERVANDDAPRQRTIWSRPLPASVLGGAALAGIVGFSVVGCYVYYPPPASALEELRIAQVEACSAALTGDHQLAEQCIDWAADLTRRLEVGVYIRHFWLSDDCRQRTKTLRDLLEQLDHAIEDDEDADSIRELALGVSHAYRECRTAYSP